MIREVEGLIHLNMQSIFLAVASEIGSAVLFHFQNGLIQNLLKEVETLT